MLEIKATVTEISNAFDGLINTLDMAKERISKPKEMSTKFPTLKCKEKKKMKKKTISKNYWGNYKSCNICKMVMPQGEEKKELEATENFPKLMSDTKAQI